MFIELAEFLRCPEPHERSNVVLVPDEIVARDVVTGRVGCPVCRKEYPIREGIVEFGGDSWPPAPAPSLGAVDPRAVRALLGLESPGGYVVLVGSAIQLCPAIAGLMDGVHFVGFGPPPGTRTLPALSLLRCAVTMPLRPGMARGVVLGAEHAAPPWPAESAEVLLRAQRLVALTEAVTEPPGIDALAAGRGMWVGTKR